MSCSKNINLYKTTLDLCSRRRSKDSNRSKLDRTLAYGGGQCSDVSANLWSLFVPKAENVHFNSWRKYT